MTDWFIEAIDVRGGLAVATQRESYLRHDILVDGGASVFISPPAFVAEYVGSRSVGFALARSHGQPGLFLHDEEVHFDTLAAVTEFVRRSYLRGAGGDGAGENGGSSPPPSPEGGEPREPPEAGLRGIEGGRGSGGDGDPVAALLTIAQINSNTSANLNVGESRPGEQLSKPDGAASKEDTRRRRLARGALRILRELVRRRPNRQPERLYWVTTLEKLVTVLTRMALWSEMLREFDDHDAATWVYGDKDQPEEYLDYYLRKLLSTDPPTPLYHWPELYWAGWRTTDMFDDLAGFPVPPRTVPFARRDGQSLQSLLTAATATPDQIMGPGALGEECAELAFFGAACLNLNGEHSPGRWSLDGDSYLEFVDRLSCRAQAWLADNIPRLVFATQVEELIRQASEVPA
jgi:hypothetical protein